VFDNHYFCIFFIIIVDENSEDMETLVSTNDLLTNNSHNVSDTLLLIENGDLTDRNDSKKIFT